MGNPVQRDVFLFGLYMGMRRGEILPLRWERVDLDKGLLRVEETKTRVPLELPVTSAQGDSGAAAAGWLATVSGWEAVPVQSERSRG